jgi:hypothetical protein
VTLAALESLCRARLTRRQSGRLSDPAHSRSVSVPTTRATARRLDALAVELGERLGAVVGGRQIAALLLMEALAELEALAAAKEAQG